MRSDLLTALAADVDALTQVPLAALSMAELQELGAAVAPLAHRLDGVLSQVAGELDVRGAGRVPDGDRAVPTVTWLRDLAATSGREAGRQVRAAVALRELPRISQAIRDGVLTVEHGRVLTRLIGKAPTQTLLDSEPALIEIARRTDPDQLAHYVRHLIATWCQPDLARDAAAAEDRRYLQVTNKHNGSWRGSFELPDAAMEQLLTVLEPLARRDGLHDTRTAGQRRADALTDIADLALRHGDLPDAGGSRPHLSYVIPLGWQPDLTGDRHAPVDADQPAAAGCPAAPWTGPATPPADPHTAVRRADRTSRPRRPGPDHQPHRRPRRHHHRPAPRRHRPRPLLHRQRLQPTTRVLRHPPPTRPRRRRQQRHRQPRPALPQTPHPLAPRPTHPRRPPRPLAPPPPTKSSRPATLNTDPAAALEPSRV